MTERVRSQMQESEINYLRKIERVTMFENVRSNSKISQHRVATSANQKISA